MMMNHQRALKSVLLVLLGLFLYIQIWNDTILFYINARFVSLTLVAAVSFLLVGASYYRLSKARDGHAHEEHDHGLLTLGGFLILSLPLLLGWLVPPQPLGASAAANRETAIGGSSGALAGAAAPRNSRPAMHVVAGDKNILDWLADFNSSPDPAIFNGEEARLVGFVYRDERFSEQQFLVARYTVSCCVADASPVGLVVHWSNTADLQPDQWVEIVGQFQVGSFAGEQLPILVAEQVSPTEVPSPPYLYP